MKIELGVMANAMMGGIISAGYANPKTSGANPAEFGRSKTRSRMGRGYW